jgi:hypothetical protein
MFGKLEWYLDSCNYNVKLCLFCISGHFYLPSQKFGQLHAVVRFYLMESREAGI